MHSFSTVVLLATLVLVLVPQSELHYAYDIATFAGTSTCRLVVLCK